MKVTTLTAAIVLLGSCSQKLIPPPSPTGTVMSLVGRSGIAHACPVNGRILTAAHVAFAMQPDRSQIPLAYVYSSGELIGFVSPVWALSSRDIATLKVDMGDLPPMNELSKDEVVTGSLVHWYEYSLSSPGVLDVIRRDSEVTSVVAGHASTKDAALPGASGSCVFDDTGKVVGLVIWRLGQEAVIVLLTGRWQPM